MSGHRPFLVLADHLTRHGIAVLRSDDRGVGESGGDFHQATTSDLATDAEAAVAWLRSRRDVDAGRIGLIGHSEGGLIAAMVAARDDDVAAIVLMAAPGVPPWQLARDQARRQAELSGGDGEAAAAFNGDIAAIIRSESDNDALRRKLQERLKDLPDAQREASLAIAMHPWQRHYLSLNPADFYRRVQCPVLALNGSRDCVVDARSNLEAIRAALAHAETRELAELNHLFQTCETGSSMEYGQIEETLARAFLEAVTEWLGRRFGA
jgi:pimeloyl-ACP methyl ester carboxylesterase